VLERRFEKRNNRYKFRVYVKEKKARAFILALLNPNSAKRPTATDALQLEWMMRGSEEDEQDDATDEVSTKRKESKEEDSSLSFQGLGGVSSSSRCGASG